MADTGVKQWVENHRAAARRVAQDARRNPLTPQEAFAAALALLNWDEAWNGSPFERRDPVSEREDAQLRETWSTLRARWHSGR